MVRGEVLEGDVDGAGYDVNLWLEVGLSDVSNRVLVEIIKDGP